MQNIEIEPIDESDDLPSEDLSKERKIPKTTSYMKDWVEKGRPVGYYDARIYKFKWPTKEWIGVYTEYVQRALDWVVLSSEIGYFNFLDDDELTKARARIEQFKKDKGLSLGDWNEIQAISYNFDFNKRKLVGKLKELGVKVKVPVTHHKEKEPQKVSDAVLIAKIFGEKVKKTPKEVSNGKVIVGTTSGCKVHVNYTGQRLGGKVRNCKVCYAFYQSIH